MDNNLFLGICGDGLPVYDRFKSHFHENKELTKELLAEAISEVKPRASFWKESVRFDHVIGCSTCVSVTDKDKVVMAVRKGRNGPTPMVLEREPEPCNAVTVILKKAREGEYYMLITAFIGESPEPEPWDKNLRPGSNEHQRAVAFWQTHALIYDEEVVEYIVK